MGRFYVTTTIPYVNAEPHIGHALEFVQADVIARSRRAAGDEVYFLSGADENAMKNVRAAEKAGVPVEEFVARNSAAFEKLLKLLNVSIDQFIRTTEERHKKGAQALWAATNPDDIYKKTYRGLYCVGCELFYKPEELDKNGECSEHPGKKPELVEEENYFFRLSKYGDWLRDIIESGELAIVPDTRKNEVLAFIERGLEDFSISRPVSRSKKWGVPVPGDDNQTMYVWYDALANYITALGYPDRNAKLYRDFWKDNPNRLHVLGKGVSRFHAVYWPAMLKSAGLPIPTMEFIHGYVTINGQKISKSLGNVIDPLAMVKKYGVDAVRYYLLREIPAYEDGDFNEERFRERYNADLANGLGNFAARVLTLYAQCIDEVGGHSSNPRIAQLVAREHAAYLTYAANFKFHDALREIWDLIAFGDSYINSEKPWESGKKEVVLDLTWLLKQIVHDLIPFLPGASKIIVQHINEKSKGGALFPRI